MNKDVRAGGGQYVFLSGGCQPLARGWMCAWLAHLGKHVIVDVFAVCEERHERLEDERDGGLTAVRDADR